MKKIIFSALIALLSFSTFAQRPNYPNNGGYNVNQPQLIISANNNKMYTVVVDNYQTYQIDGRKNNNDDININNLVAGNHLVTIYEQRKNIFGQQRMEQIYNSYVFLQQGVETTMQVNAFGKVQVNQRQVYNNNNNGGYGNNYPINNNGGCNTGHNNDNKTNNGRYGNNGRWEQNKNKKRGYNP